ncbi:MAG: pantoate--beta-alanine ligase [Flavitalea sp.]
MILFKRADALSEYLQKQRSRSNRIGFVPTMGALHDGHLELVQQSLKEDLLTVCSIFVNPTQFNNATDFEKYPKTIADDIAKLEAAGTDILFIPGVSDIYPNGTSGLERFDLGYLETILEGSSRPGHFQGVCQVMSRLITIVNPHLLFMGQKDYQQCMVVSRLISIMNHPVKLITAPTVRQADGLAMSSRNRRLTDSGRTTATSIFQAMTTIRNNIKPGSLLPLIAKAEKHLTSRGFTVDYIEIATANDLKITHEWDGKTSLVCLVAAFLEEVRLIDNMVIS